MLDFYTCTECGRCQEVCPAYGSGLPLSPKLLMMGLRDNLIAFGDATANGTATVGAADGTAAEDTGGAGAATADGDATAVPPLIDGAVSTEALWACTTCYACDQECPLFIEHVTPIVDMRRHLVIEGEMDDMLQDALANLGRYGNSFGKSGRARAKWTAGLEPKIADATKEAVDYLWFVGDYASYSASVIEATRQTAEIFRAAAVDFGILYAAESNSGNDVRRVGEEGLFEMLVEKNLEALEASEHRAIVTTDPHSYNALLNEYPAANGAPRQVLHYSELLAELIESGQLEMPVALERKVTYHDPCYLGRYNGIYDAPRKVIEATGCRLVEMPRHGDRALCCGAGGGRIWMDEGEVGERPSEARVREAADLRGVDTMIVACPKDVTMYQDAVKTTGLEGQLEVLDLASLVYEAMGLEQEA